MIYHTFMPTVVNNPNPKIGLALSKYFYTDLLGVSWYHYWGPCGKKDDARCVPMSYAGELVDGLSNNYSGWLLVFNEPELVSPAGSNISVAKAIIEYTALREAYPLARMCVGNISQSGLAWLQSFGQSCQSIPDAWGIHAYTSDQTNTDVAVKFIEDTHSLLGGNYWVTEWADLNGNVSRNETMRQYLNSIPWIDRWAYYTNRGDSWYPSNWKTELFYQDGSPTEVGEWWLSR
jgi:hypothetical protein